jgi:hypothetical protein
LTSETFYYSRRKVLWNLVFLAGSIGLAVWMCVLAMTSGATRHGMNVAPLVVIVSIAWSCLAAFGLIMSSPCLFAPFAVRIEPGRLHLFSSALSWPPRLVETRIDVPDGVTLIVHDYGVTSETALSGVRDGRPCSIRGASMVWSYVDYPATARDFVQAMGRTGD